MNDIIKSAALVALVIALVIIAPFLSVWSLNTLFPALAIPYTLETWCASLILCGVFSNTVTKNKKES